MKSRYMLIAAMLAATMSGCDDKESLGSGGSQPDSTETSTIETYIATQVPDVSGARAESRAYVDTLSEVEQAPMNVAGARAFLGKLSAIGICIDESLEGASTSSDEVIQELKARTLNSEGRTDAYLALNELMGNTVTSLEEIRGMASCATDGRR